MNTFRRQQLRGFVVTVLTASLLILSVAFTIVGYAAGEGNYQQIDAIETRYLTVGFLQEQESQRMIHMGNDVRGMDEGYDRYWAVTRIWRNNNYVRLQDGTIHWDDGMEYRSSTLFENIAAEAPQITSINRSSILSANVKGVYGLSSGQLNEHQYIRAFDDHGVNFCVVLIKEDNSGFDRYTKSVLRNDVGSGCVILSVQSSFEPQAVVSAHPYVASRINSRLGQTSYHDQTSYESLMDENGETMMEHGKRYLLRCFFADYPILTGYAKDKDGNSYYGPFRYGGPLDDKWFPEGSSDILYARQLYPYFAPTTDVLDRHENYLDAIGSAPENFALEIGSTIRESSGIGLKYYFYTTPEDSLPFITEIPGTLTVEEFLQTEDGAVWRDVIIPMAEINQQSATVILTDNVDYISGFSSGEAYVLDGREIEPAEYESGSKVCLISASYAEANGLTVGDTLTLDYYDTGYFLHTGEQEMVTRTVYEMTTTHNPLQESNRIGYEAEYEIVGIYAAPEWEFGAQTFHADTIFVPKASVPNAEAYEDPALPLLNSIVIQNGSEEAFEAYMQEQGYGGYYEFYDHDYSSNIAGFEAMALNAQRLLILGLIVLAVTCILFYYLNFRRMIPVARNMRRLGHSRFGVWLKILTTTLPLIILSVLGGGILGAYSFDYITNELLNTEIFLDLNTVKQITLTAAIALCLPPVLIAIPISLPRLMKRK